MAEFMREQVKMFQALQRSQQDGQGGDSSVSYLLGDSTTGPISLRGTEDFEGAAAWIAARAQPGDAVIGVEYQPPVFPTGRPWDRYGVPLHGPPRLATNGIHLVRPADRIDHERIWLMASSLPRSVDLVAQLEGTHRVEERREFGWRPVVELWVRREPRSDER